MSQVGRTNFDCHPINVTWSSSTSSISWCSCWSRNATWGILSATGDTCLWSWSTVVQGGGGGGTSGLPPPAPTPTAALLDSTAVLSGKSMSWRGGKGDVLRYGFSSLVGIPSSLRRSGLKTSPSLNNAASCSLQPLSSLSKQQPTNLSLPKINTN